MSLITKRIGKIIKTGNTFAVSLKEEFSIIELNDGDLVNISVIDNVEGKKRIVIEELDK